MSHPVPFPAAVPALIGDRVRLRELSEDDIPAWFTRATDVESAQLAGDPVPTSIDQGPAWLQRHRERFARRTGIQWAIVPNAAAHSVGSIGLSLHANTPDSASLGIVIGRRDWGNGFGTDAARAVIGYAFDTLGLDSIRAEALTRNLASARLLLKAGFRRVGMITETGPSGHVPEQLFQYVLCRLHHIGHTSAQV